MGELRVELMTELDPELVEKLPGSVAVVVVPPTGLELVLTVGDRVGVRVGDTVGVGLWEDGEGVGDDDLVGVRLGVGRGFFELTLAGATTTAVRGAASGTYGLLVVS
jgi:hypothetical protein